MTNLAVAKASFELHAEVRVVRESRLNEQRSILGSCAIRQVTTEILGP